MLSAPPEGARAFVLTENNRQVIDVRLNGVRAECTDEKNGNVLMSVKTGLKMTRRLIENAEPDIAIVPMMTAILNSEDIVLFNDEFGYKTGFNKDLEELYPVVEFELIIIILHSVGSGV